MKKQLILFLSNLIPNRQKRKEFRIRTRKKYLKVDVTKMRLGISYSVWDGEELLEASITCVRSQAQHINVVWQKESWSGEKCSDDLEPLLLSLKARGLVDELIVYPHQGVTHNAAGEERKKRNVGLNAAREAGCTHFMTMDTDEFYVPDEFCKAKELILARGITHSAVPIYVYWKTPNYRQRDMSSLAVPFIYRITSSSRLSKDEHFPVHADAARHLPYQEGGGDRFFFVTDTAMHHMSYVRKDLGRKLKNASMRRDAGHQEVWEIYNDISDATLEKYGLIKVENIFNITGFSHCPDTRRQDNDRPR